MKSLTFNVALLIGMAIAIPAWSAQSGKEVYEKACSYCHATGLAGAPRYGAAADWGPRAAKGITELHKSSLKGTAKGMPTKGGNLTFTDAEVEGAVDYMLTAVKDAIKEGEYKPAAEPPQVVQTPIQHEALAFNRLLKPAGQRNLSPAEDGIHDPDNDGTLALQPPLTGYVGLPKSFAGNRINWVEALTTKKISPRYDKTDAKLAPLVMDMNVVRQVKGSMPDVVYPHKQHTEWLDCSNCHPSIFIPQKGANSISMAAIMLGEKCGVCHGKVAFPVSECRLCHSRKKEIARAPPRVPQ